MDFGDVSLVDLSIGLEPGVDSEPFPPTVEYYDHEQGARSSTVR